MICIADINIGSNIGDRRALIERAVARVSALSLAPARVSAPVESPPWGYDSPNPFLNVGLQILISLDPQSLLDTLINIQQEISDAPHRTPAGTYADRPVDIDLIALTPAPDGHNDARASLVIDTPSLILPHPRMHLRPFVLIPMAELHPRWRHPLLGLTPEQLLNRL